MGQFGRKTASETPAAELAPTNLRQATAVADALMKASTRPTVSEAKDFIRDQIFLRIEPLVAVRISQQDLMVSVNKLVAEIATGRKILLNQD
ncbi:MAG: CpaF family protein, partial [Bradyrhizobium sp.]|nr:CpaF family protein [Bradyrhizobium sp.]